jgi:uncharacterized protein YqjF (DUF2071 family)
MSEGRIRHEAVPAPPSFPWVWSQHWLDVLFLHWRLSPAELRSHVPRALEVQTYGGAAWVSLVHFRLRVRPRGLPFVPGFSNLLEANLRTYVQREDRPGIWFLDVLADNRLAIQIARRLTPMPYAKAGFRYERDGDEYLYEIRVGDGQKKTQGAADRAGASSATELSVRFQTGAGQPLLAGSLDEWLLERYRLYIRGRRSVLMLADVVHPPWTVHETRLTQFSNTIGRRVNLDLSRPPDCVHYSPGVKALFGGFRRVDHWSEALQPVSRTLPSAATGTLTTAGRIRTGPASSD